MSKTLRLGDTGPEVIELQLLLTKSGYSVGPVDGEFKTATLAAVYYFQKKKGLMEDGLVGPQTLKALKDNYGLMSVQLTPGLVDTYNEATALPSFMPKTAVDLRMSEAIAMMQTCDGGQGCRYGGWRDPYFFESDEFKNGNAFPIPKVGRIVKGHDLTSPIHGGTCSPWAGLFLGWWLCCNADYNFRIGRSARWIATWPHDKVYKGKSIPGFGEYSDVHGELRLEHTPLSTLYAKWEWLNHINIVEMDHHIILVLKVGENALNLYNPLDSTQKLPAGLYRFGADGYYPRINGKKYYSGTKQTFRLLEHDEKTNQKWDVYRVTDLNPDTAAPDTGPWSGRTPWKLTLR